MKAPVTDWRWGTRGPLGRHRGKLTAAIVALVLVASAAIPLAVVFLGVLLVALVALDAGVPGLVPGLGTVFAVPLAPASRRRPRLLLAASCGLLLVACGTAGARLGGQLRTEWELRRSRRLSTEQQVTAHVERARGHLAANEVELAELALMDACRIPAIDPAQQRQVDELLERVRSARDPDAILAILVRLPANEFEAFAGGGSVPDALVFEERALTYRAVEIARARIEEARTRRARP